MTALSPISTAGLPKEPPLTDPQDLYPEKGDPYEDTPDNRQLISERMEQRLMKARNHRSLFEREWYQALLFYAGHHWFVFDRNRGQFRPRGGPKWFPKPVTNKVMEKANDNIASLLMTPAQMSWEPKRDTPSSIAAADISGQIDETIAEEAGRPQNDRVIALWNVLTGNAFLESYYDPSEEHGQTFVQHEECQQCGAVSTPVAIKEAGGECPGCGSEELKPALERTGAFCPQCRESGVEVPPAPPQLAFTPCPACAASAVVNPNLPQIAGAAVPPAAGNGISGAGAPPPMQIPMLQPSYGEEKIGHRAPRGKLCERVRSPLEIFFDHINVRSFDEGGGLRWYIGAELIDLQEAKEKFGTDLGPGSSVTPGQSASLSMQYLESLSVLTAVIDPATGPTTSAGSGGGNAARVLYETFRELPSRRFPQGLEAKRVQGANGRVVEFGPLPYHRTDEEGNPDPTRPFLPIVHYRFHLQAGRAYGRTPISDIVPLNVARNRAEAMMMVSEARMANPVWLIPEGVMVRDPTGEPGELVRYNSLSAGQGRAPKPERIPGLAPPEYFMARMRDLDEQMEKLSGSFDIAHGEAPRGVTAASALALLGERQQRSVSPQVTAWEMSQEERVRQQMYIFREYGVTERIRPRRDGISKWAFQVWQASDLGGNVNVRVIAGSAMPKSRAQKMATVEAEVKMGAVNLQNPEVLRRLHEIYGTTELVQPYETDVKDAQQEQEMWLRMARVEKNGKMMRFRPIIDNHQIHATEHRTFGMTDGFREVEEKAANGDAAAQVAVDDFYNNLKQHLTALAPPPPELAPPSGKAPTGPGAGRPEGTGPVLNAGRDEATGETRAISEPPTNSPS